MDDKDKIDKWLTRVNVVLQIIAIPIAAYWAFTRFVAEEAPALELRPKVTGELSWKEYSENECIAYHRVKFENIGKSSIELTDVMLRVWRRNVPALAGEAQYMHPFAAPNEAAIAEVSLTEFLRSRYPPNVADETGAEFLVKRAPGRMMLFVVNGTSKIAGGKSDKWFDHQWDFVCGEVK